jgi:hypothetical protein
MDNIEKEMIRVLNLPFYEEYKNLHARGEIRINHFNDSDDRHLEYQFSNLTTLYRLSDAYHQLLLLKSLPKKADSFANFFISISTTLTGFFLSLKCIFDSVAQEISILFSERSIDDGSVYFSNIIKKCPQTPQLLKDKIEQIKTENWYDEIGKYRNRLAHRSILPTSLSNIYPHKLSLLKANLPFSKVIQVHRGKEMYNVSNDFQYPNHDIPEQCGFYFQKTKEAIQEIWEICYTFLKKEI